MMMRRAVSPLMLLLLLPACAGGSAAELCAGGEPGVTPVLASKPRLWREPAELRELWRAAGTREDEALALPAAVTISRSGHAAIPDFQLGEVFVVDPEGRWLGAWARSGAGPGEVKTPIAAAWDTDGVAAVWDVVGSKVVWLGPTGPGRADLPVDPAFSTSVTASGQVLWAAVQADGTVLTKDRRPAGAPSGEVQPQREALLRLAPGRRSADTLAHAEVETLTGDFSGLLVPGSTGLLAASSADGTLAISDSPGEYRVRLESPSGSTRMLCRDAAALPISGRERGDQEEAQPGSPAAALRSAPPVENPHPFGRLFFDADGRLWVQRERPSPSDGWDALYGVAGATYDVYSPEAEYLGEVKAPPGARLQGAVGDRVWALMAGELDEPWVIQYRIESPP